MKDYTHFACFRSVWSLTVGADWQAAAEEHYCIEAGGLPSALNVPGDRDFVLEIKAHLLAELAAPRARLQDLLAQTDAMERDVVRRLDDAAIAAASRNIEFGPHDGIAKDILMEGEFA